MIVLTLFLICVFIALGIGVLAGISDVRGLIIPNSYSLYIVSSFVVAYTILFFSGNTQVFGGICSHILSAGLMFVTTFAMFALRMIGAGDSKFATACALWVSMQHLPAFAFYMVFMGGVLGVYALVVQNYKPFANPAEGGWIAQVQGGASKVPYGVAITFGMFIAFIHAGYFDSAVLSSFMIAKEGG